MNNLHFSDICQLPAHWTNSKTWQETCTKPRTTKQASSPNNNPVLATIAFLPFLVILGCCLGVALRRRYGTQKMIAQLHQIMTLERALQINHHKLQ